MFGGCVETDLRSLCVNVLSGVRDANDPLNRVPLTRFCVSDNDLTFFPADAEPAPISEELRERWKDAFNRSGDIDAVLSLLDDRPDLIEVRPWLEYDLTALEATANRCVWHRPDEYELAVHLIARGARHDLPTCAGWGVGAGGESTQH